MGRWNNGIPMTNFHLLSILIAIYHSLLGEGRVSERGTFGCVIRLKNISSYFGTFRVKFYRSEKVY